MVQTLRFTRGNLPHWLVADRPYFVTLRLHGTLPKQVVAEMKAERDRLEQSDCRDPETWSAMRKRQFLRMEDILHKMDLNRSWLTDERVAPIILQSLKWLRETAGWTIYAAVLMSNHLHAVLRNMSGRNGDLLSDLERFKRFTGREANGILGRAGAFWAREDFDHWCRTPDKTEAAIHYVMNNPVNSGLCTKPEQWPWLLVETSP